MMVAMSFRLWQREPEGAAFADLAVHPDRPAVQLDQPPRQRKSETGAFVLAAGRGIELREFLEQFWLIVRGDSDARVCDRDSNTGCVTVAAASAIGCEL